MAVVTLVSHPDLHALTKGGRMLYQFEGAGRYQTSGTKAVAVLFVSAPTTDGRTINLRWNGKTYPIVFRASPEEPNEFPTGDGSSDYVDELVDQLAGYYPIRQDFVVTRYDPTQLPGVLLTARRPGVAYNLEIVNPPVGSPLTLGTSVQGADAILRPQYSIYAEVFLQNPGTDGTDLDEHYSQIFHSPIDTDESGAAQFNVGNIIHAELTPDWPTWSFLNPSGGPNSNRKYYIAYGECYGLPRQIGRLTRDSVRYVYLGGADFKHRASGGYQLNRFDSSGDENKALRFGSQTRYVLADEPQFLTFVNQRSAALTAVKLICTLTYSDNSTDVFDDLYAPQSLPIGRKITYAVGYSQLHLDTAADPDKVLTEYSVNLQVDGDDWSIAYRYVLNASYHPYARHFVYLNSLGAPETLTTFGKGSQELSLFFEQAERYLPAYYEVADGQFVSYDLSTQQQVSVATGFWPETVVRTWNDFYRSPYKFRLIGNDALPIGLVSKSIKQAKDGDTLFGHQFEYVYLYKDDFYTGQEADEIGDGTPPLNFKMTGGSVVINTPTVTRNIDDTVPNLVRAITQNDITAWTQAALRPNPQTLGFLTQSTGSQLFRGKNQLISWLTDIGDKPNVVSKSQALQLIAQTQGITVRLKSWTTLNEPS